MELNGSDWGSLLPMSALSHSSPGLRISHGPPPGSPPPFSPWPLSPRLNQNQSSAPGSSLLARVLGNSPACPLKTSVQVFDMWKMKTPDLKNTDKGHFLICKVTCKKKRILQGNKKQSQLGLDLMSHFYRTEQNDTGRLKFQGTQQSRRPVASVTHPLGKLKMYPSPPARAKGHCDQ